MKRIMCVYIYVVDTYMIKDHGLSRSLLKKSKPLRNFLSVTFNTVRLDIIYEYMCIYELNFLWIEDCNKFQSIIFRTV